MVGIMLEKWHTDFSVIMGQSGRYLGFQVSVSYLLAPFVEPTWQSGAPFLVLKPWEQKS